MNPVLKYGLVALFAIGGLLSVTSVGEVRKPTTPRVAAGVVLVNAIFIYFLLVQP